MTSDGILDLRRFPQSLLSDRPSQSFFSFKRKATVALDILLVTNNIGTSKGGCKVLRFERNTVHVPTSAVVIPLGIEFQVLY